MGEQDPYSVAIAPDGDLVLSRISYGDEVKVSTEGGCRSVVI